jgi:hypothetical protein
MKDFQPSYRGFHKDIEQYLTSIGKREKQKDGMVVFRGYDDALSLMFRMYLEKNELSSLAKEFRKWNWEHQYNDYLTELTEALKKDKDWENLKVLWEKGVLQKRKKLFNEIWKIEKDAPGTISHKSIVEVKDRLLETLSDVIKLARDYGSIADVERFEKMERRVQEGNRA